MSINVQIKGAKEVSNLLVMIPKRMQEEVLIANDEFARFVQKSAKLRAPRDTGDLSRSIIVKKGKMKVEIIVDSPYGIFQELGFRPHWVHSSMSSRGAGTIGSRLGKRGFIFVREFKPFITPALEMAITRLPMMLQRAIEKAVIKSRR
jgi:hypothetical protein